MNSKSFQLNRWNYFSHPILSILTVNKGVKNLFKSIIDTLFLT